MKKITLIVLSLSLTWQINAQTSENFLQKRNELKLDVAYFFVPALKIEYEFLLNNWSSIGLYAFHNFRSAPIFKNQILGNYRVYLGLLPDKGGFFIEGNLGLFHGYNSWDLFEPYPKNHTAFGIGFALGWKWYIRKSDIVFEIFAGTGGLFSNNDRSNGRGYPRLGICVGKRF